MKNKNNPGLSSVEADPASRWSSEAIRAQLKRILGHAEFQATDKMHDFLRFVVEETLAGRSRHIKGFTIATEVYGRGADFDAAHDPVVRIQAGRLRRAIERYYLVSGGQDPIRIEIPKGSYVPVFAKGPDSKPLPSRRLAFQTQNTLAESCPLLLITPFEDLTEKPEFTHLGLGIAAELETELGHCADLRITQDHEGILSMEKLGIRPDFTVGGSIFCDDRSLKVIARLIDNRTGVHLWTDSFKLPLESAHLIDFQENIANLISAQIAPEPGVIVRAMTTVSRHRSTPNLTTYEAVLKGYSYWEKIDAVSYQQALEALQHVVNNGCDSGRVFTMLSLLYADNIALEHYGPGRSSLNDALHLAREGALLEPCNQMSHIALSRIHFLRNDLDQALSDVETALALQPESLFFLDRIGYMLTLLGEWDRGEQFTRKAIRLNPFYRVFVHYGLWLNAFRQKKYKRALEESERIAETGIFWGPLSRAATLGLLGRSAEGEDAARQLLLMKPNFRERGRLLIRHYVKFPEIADQLVEGLAFAGLNID